MPNPVTCPDAKEYDQLRRGEMSLAEVERLARHVETCAACVARVQRMPLDDTLVESLRVQATLTDAREKDRVAELVARLQHLRVPAAGPSGEATAALASSAPAPSGPGEGTQEVYEFLAPPQAPGEIGRLGPYRVLSVLGAGGMGVVFRAEDVKLKRPVALKAMRPAIANNAAAGQRFQREAEATAAIKHDHIVTIYQVGEERGVPFLAMEFLQGEALDDRLKREGKLSLPEALRIARETAEGLAAAHERGLVHRDIKPGNLWLEGQRGRVKILDFGLARTAGDDMHLTQTGTILGTPAYMAPEQARGEAPDARCDLFSLGCVLYRMVTGQLPFHGKDTMSMLMALATQQPRPPRELNPQLPPALNNLIQRLLAKNVADRPVSAADVVKAIESIEASLTSPRPAAPPAASGPADDEVTRRMRRPPLAAESRRRRARIAAGVLGMLSVAAAAATIVIRLRTPDGKEITIEAPEGTTVTVGPKDDGAKPPPPAVPAASPLDRLDPKDVPAPERFDWQPKELVAVLGEHRLRHRSGPAMTVLSADGKTLASFVPRYGADTEVSLWDAASGEKLLSLPTTHAGVLSCAFEHGGERLYAVALGDSAKGSQLLEWDTTTGERKPAHKLDPPARFVACAPNAVLFLGCDDGSVRVLNGDTKKEIKILRGHKGAVTWMTPVLHRQTVATTGEDNVTKVWDLDKGEEVYSLKHDDIGMTPVAISPHGTMLAGRSKEGVALWRQDTKQRQVVYTRPEGVSGSECAAFDFTGTWLALGDAFGRVRMQYVPREKADSLPPPSMTVRAMEGEIASLLLSHDSRTLIVGGRYGCVRLRKIATDEKVLGAHQYPVRSLAALANTQVVSLSAEGTVGFWAPANPGKALRTLTEDVRCLAALPDGKSFVTGGGDGQVRLRDAADGKERVKLARHRLAVLALASSPDGKTVASGSADGAVIAWGVAEGEERFRLTGQGTGVSSLAYAPDGKSFAVGRADGRITIHDPHTGGVRRTLKDQGSPVLVAWTPDGGALISCAREKWGVRVWDVATGQQRFLLGETGPVHSLAVSPKGARFATGMEDGAVHFWEWTAYREPVVWHPDCFYGKSPVTALAFSADGRRVLAGAANAHLAVADPTMGEELSPSRGHTAPVNLLAFAPDGRTLTTASTQDSSARVWDVTGGKETRMLRFCFFDLGPRDLSRDGQFVAWGGVPGRPGAGPTWVPAMVFDLRAGPPPWLTPAGNAPLSVVRTPDGKILAQVGIDFWDAAAGEKLARFYRAVENPDDPKAAEQDPLKQFVASAPGNLRGLQLSPDGRLLAVASEGGTVKVWDVRAAKELWRVNGREGDLPQFTADGRHLALGNSDGTVYVLRLEAAPAGR